ncbi:uncharacterized protein [Cicer arietinum]|uniref:uncharacterized protein isoform X3 n=1 Tax=Cicer arietinum TaxID=3827 RepID=UPI003CC62CDA
MFATHRHRSLLHLNALTFSQSLKPNPLFLPFSLHFSTNTSDSPSFAVSYLIHNFGFSPLLANKLCSTYRVKFKTAQNPDSVLTFFRNQGFSDSQLRDTIAKAPWLLSCNPLKRVLPKFQFFLSKGASNSDIVNLVSKNPLLLSSSLENQIVPAYEFVYRFLKSHKNTIACARGNPSFFGHIYMPRNIKLLIENGVTDSNIATLLQLWSRAFKLRTTDTLKVVEELKDMGFNPKQTIFAVAMAAKASLSKARWKEKVDAFKKWGWSDQDVMEAFRRQPHCMLTSIDKINLVMDFWVNELGWDALAIVKRPRVLGASLERRIKPRASVLQYLLNKGGIFLSVEPL